MQLIYGFHPVVQAVKSGRAKKIILAQNTNSNIGNHKRDRRKDSRNGKKTESKRNTAIISENVHNLPIEYWKAEKFEAKFPNTTHQLCAAECANLQFTSIDIILSGTSSDRLSQQDTPLYLALDGVTDPHNLGACIRSAVAFSAAGLIFATHNSAPLNAAAIKASAGMVELLPLIKVPNLVRALEQLQQKGFWVIAAEGAASQSQSLEDLDCRRPLVLILGDESKGISKLALEKSDHLCRIDINSKLDSLNVSNAAAVLMHHIRLRQK